MWTTSPECWSSPRLKRQEASFSHYYWWHLLWDSKALSRLVVGAIWPCFKAWLNDDDRPRAQTVHRIGVLLYSIQRKYPICQPSWIFLGTWHFKLGLRVFGSYGMWWYKFFGVKFYSNWCLRKALKIHMMICRYLEYSTLLYWWLHHTDS